jgi:hypothetical protein
MCFNPLRAELPPEGGRPILDPEGSLKLPCGKCSLCISKRAIEWATRARHEISEHNENCFITLTYAPENLNSDFIIKKDFQDFMKRLRKKSRKPIRYMVSYEYGSLTFRPHMHAILFGYSPAKQKHTLNSPSGHKLFTSPIMDELWDKGFHSIGEANEETAYYIASYALKGKERTIIHPNTGEECDIRDQMDSSKRPAIGLKYFEKNYEQLINTNNMLPRYYQKKLEEIDPLAFEMYQNKVQLNLKERSSYENYAKFVIDSQKSSLHVPHFREDIGTDKQIKTKEYLERRLKSLRDSYTPYMKKEKDHVKNVRNS